MITTFTLENFADAPSSGRARFCLLFAKGDMPSGKIPRIRAGGADVAAQFDELGHVWSDYSARLMVCTMAAHDFSPLEKRLFQVDAVAGSYTYPTMKKLSDVTALHDFKVRFTTVTQSDDSTTKPHGSGSFTASLNTFAAKTTRVKTYNRGKVAMSWRVWGLAKDDATGKEDPDLKVTFYVTAHLDPVSNAIVDVEHSAKVSQ